MSSEWTRGGRWNPVRYRWSLVIAATGQVCIPFAAMAGDSLGFVLATVLAVLGIVSAGLLLLARSDRSSADQLTARTQAVTPAIGRPLVALGTVMEAAEAAGYQRLP